MRLARPARSDLGAAGAVVARGAFVEEYGWLGPEAEPIFCCAHLPERPAETGIVVCAPLFAEFVRNYRKEVELARVLAGRGAAVLRFHYRGCGHSFGDPGAVGFDGLLRDARAAADELGRRAGCDRIAFVGTRLGAYIASEVAAELGGAGVVLWDPPPDGSGYFRELFRALFIHNLRRGGGRPPSREQLLSELRERGRVDVLGYELTKALQEPVDRLTLADGLGACPAPALLVQLGLSDSLRPEYADVVRAREAVGRDTDTVLVPLEEGWWFAGDAWDVGAAAAEVASLVEETASWLLRRLGETP